MLEGDGAAECERAYVLVEEPTWLRAHGLEKRGRLTLCTHNDALIEDRINPEKLIQLAICDYRGKMGVLTMFVRV